MSIIGESSTELSRNNRSASSPAELPTNNSITSSNDVPLKKVNTFFSSKSPRGGNKYAGPSPHNSRTFRQNLRRQNLKKKSSNQLDDDGYSTDGSATDGSEYGGGGGGGNNYAQSKFDRNWNSSKYENIWLKRIDAFWGVTSRHSSLEAELFGGLSLFVVSVYIVFVSPLYQTGIIFLDSTKIGVMDDLPNYLSELSLSTAILTCVATFAMSFVCNTPFLIAPGMGFNRFFVEYFIVFAGLSWKSALGACFIAAILYFLLVLLLFFGVCKPLFFTLPSHFRTGIGIGIGFFLGFLGLQTNTGMGIITTQNNELGLITEYHYSFLLSLGGLVMLGALYEKKYKSAYIITFLVITIIDVIIRGAYGEQIIDGSDFFKFDLSHIVGQLNFDFDNVKRVILAIYILVMHKIFDVIGTVLTVAQCMIAQTKRGREAYSGRVFKFLTSSSIQLRRIFIVDAIFMLLAPIMGLSPSTMFIESVVPLTVGARTGLTSFIASLCFLITVLFMPLFSLIPTSATGVILFSVAVAVSRLFYYIDFTNISAGLPALFSVLLIPLSGHISLGIALAFVVGAKLWLLDGTFRSAFEVVDKCSLWYVLSILIFFYIGSWMMILMTLNVFD